MWAAVDKWIIPALIVLIAGGRLVLLNSTRGLRNKNPGNIREGAGGGIQWNGEAAIDRDAEFEEFESFEMGIRAMGRILASYRRQGFETVEQVISRWAPPVENDTTSYINSVVNQSGVLAGDKVTKENEARVIAAIIHHENGINPFSLDFIQRSVDIA